MHFRAVVLVVGVATASPAAAQSLSPVDGTWHLTGRVVATACADRCATRSQRVDQQVAVTNGQLSGAEGLAPACEGGVSESEFAGLSTFVPGRRGWLRLRIVDRPRFLQLMRRCIGFQSLRLGRLAGRVKIAPDGLSFRERVFVSGSVSVYGRTATFSATGRVRAEWVGDAAGSLGSLRAAALARVLDATLAAE